MVDPPEVLPPSVRILEPEDGDFFDPDEPIEFEGTASDPEGATDLEFEWFASYDFGEDGSGTELIGTSPSFSWTPSDDLPVPFCSSFTLEIDLEVTNPEGATGTDTIEIHTICID